MPEAEQPEPNEELLTRYLLGALDQAETERLDERSFTDDGFALRLDIAEHELVDTFLRGGLTGDDLARFHAHYLASPKRAAKVALARELQHFEEQETTARSRRAAARANGTQRSVSSVRGWFTVPRLGLQWAFACVAAATLLAAGYLFVEDIRLQNEVSGARIARVGLDKQNRDLQRQIQGQRAVNEQMSSELQNLHQAQTAVDQIKAVAAILMPPSRGAGKIETVSLAPDTTLLVLLVRLEADEFPIYGVELKAGGTNQVVWQRKNLKAEASGPDKNLSVSLPAHLLKQHLYELQLTGVSKQGSTEFLSDYPFKVVIE